MKKPCKLGLLCIGRGYARCIEEGKELGVMACWNTVALKYGAYNKSNLGFDS